MGRPERHGVQREKIARPPCPFMDRGPLLLGMRKVQETVRGSAARATVGSRDRKPGCCQQPGHQGFS